MYGNLFERGETMKKDITKARKLVLLDHLVQTNGDAAQIAKLRRELNVDEKRSAKPVQKRVKRDKLDKDLLEKQYFRLRALQLTDQEIAFALVISSAAISELKMSFADDEYIEKVEEYDDSRIVQNFRRMRKKRWRDL